MIEAEELSSSPIALNILTVMIIICAVVVLFIDGETMGALFPAVSLNKVLVHPRLIEAQRAEVARLLDMKITKVAFRARGPHLSCST